MSAPLRGPAVKRRTLLVATFSTFAASVFMTVRKVLEFAGAPVGEKQSDFVFPRPAQPALARVATPADSTIPFAQRGGFINDASHLNRTGVYGIVNIGNETDVRNALQFARERGGGLKMTAAGQRHSMGGQTFVHNGLVLDMRGLRRITIDAAAQTVNVQSGAVWADVQRALDAQGLSVKAMQSINIFTVGGTLSVNAHGIAHDPGPIAPTVKSLRVMLTNGEIKTASPSVNPDLFRHVLGGYGLCGVILDVDLDIVANEMYERHTTYMGYRDFTDFYRRDVDGNSAVGLVYGRLSVSPSSYLREAAIHVYQRTPYSGPLPALVPDSHDALQRFVINVSKTGSMGRRLRWILEKNVEPRIHACTGDGVCLVSRNQEMYDSMHYLQNRLPDTDILQEYFIPYDRMGEFVDGLRAVVQRTGANLILVGHGPDRARLEARAGTLGIAGHVQSWHRHLNHVGLDAFDFGGYDFLRLELIK